MSYVPSSHPRPQAINLQNVPFQADMLFSRADEIGKQVEKEERHPGYRRKPEVGDWLEEVEEVRRALQQIEESVEYGASSSRNTLQGKVDQLRQKIRKLMNSGHFPDGLTLFDESNVVLLGFTKLRGQAFAHNLSQILSWLNNGVCRIGVWGAGGGGKTTLVRHIHDKLLRNVEMSVENVHWVTVSDGTTIPGLQSKIAKSIGCDYISEEDDVIIRAGKLCQELSSRKRSLLILDDVWDDFMLEEVGIPDGFKLVITTRHRDVCHRMECEKIVKVECLSKEDSWDFFREVLGSIYHILPQEGKAIARLISEKCAGLPLSIKVVAASMRGVDDIQEWRNALAELTEPTRCHHGMENEVFPSLKLSFDRLNDILLQECFLYCALYPEDYEFLRGGGVWSDWTDWNSFPKQEATLIEAWIAEGLLEGMDSRQEQVDKGCVVLNKLLNACLLEPVAQLGRRVKMHDLVREMAVKVGREYHGYLRKAVKYQQDRALREVGWMEDLTKVSMIGCEISAVSPVVPPNCSNLRTLLLRQNPIAHVPHDFFLLMKSLNVLDLSHTEVKKLPDSVSDLENLMALLFNGRKKLEYVPSLAKLRKLRELHLRGCSRLCALPKGMEGLTSLKLFDWGGRAPLSGVIPILPRLQELRLDPEFQSIKERKVHFWGPFLTYKGIMGVKESIKGVDLAQLVCLERLLGCRFSEMDDFCCYVNSPHHLQLNQYEFYVANGYVSPLLSCPIWYSLSKSVVLDGWRSEELTMLPRDVEGVSFHECDFGTTRSMDMLPCLQGFVGETKDIRISYCKKMEFVWSEASSLSSPFPKLEILRLDDLYDFKGLVKGGVLTPPPGSLQYLRQLSIDCCGGMLKKLFTPLMARDHFQNLEQLRIRKCKGLEEVIGAWEEGDDNADIMEAAGDRGIAQQEHHLPQYFPNLKELTLTFLPRLKRLCSHRVGVLSSASIESIRVFECPKLKKLPLSLPSNSGGLLCAPPRLQEIEAVRAWWESLEWDSLEAKIILEQFLTHVNILAPNHIFF